MKRVKKYQKGVASFKGYNLDLGLAPNVSVIDNTQIFRPNAFINKQVLDEEKAREQARYMSEVSTARPKTTFSEANRKKLNQQFANTHPYANIDDQYNLSPAYSQRTMEGVPLPNTQAETINRGLNTAGERIDQALLATGAYDLGRLGVKGLGIIGDEIIANTALKNAYKYNPWAFKPNPEAYYRGIGQEGLKDALESGVLRTNRNPTWEPVFHKIGTPGDSPYFFSGKNFEGIKEYEPNIFAEVVNQPMRPRVFSRIAGSGDNSVFQPIRYTGEKFLGKDIVEKLPEIPLGENVKFYQKDWLRGYKPVNVSKASNFGGLFARFNPKNLKTESGEEWINKWYNDPDFIRRYNNSNDSYVHEAQAFQNTLLNRLRQYQPKNYINLLKDKGVGKYLDASFTSNGISWGTPKSIYVNRSAYAPFNRQGLESVKTHEITHLIEKNGTLLKPQDQEKLLKPFGYSNIKEIPSDPGFLKRISGDNPQYLLDPTEIHARMNQARFDLGLTPKDEFTEEMFNHISKNKDWYDLNRYIKDKKGFIDLMNNFWAVPAIGIGAALQQKQKGGMIPKYQKGRTVGFLQQAKNKAYEYGELTKNKLAEYEQNFNSWLGDPMGKSQIVGTQSANRGIDPKTRKFFQEDPVDNIRHTVAGQYTAQAIKNKFPSGMQITGIPQVTGFLGSTLMGIGHELVSNKYTHPRDYPNYTFGDALREAGEDIYNNTLGAYLGALPFIDPQAKTNFIRNLSYKNQLPDGYANNGPSMYFKKQDGGVIPKYQDGKLVHPPMKLETPLMGPYDLPTFKVIGKKLAPSNISTYGFDNNAVPIENVNSFDDTSSFSTFNTVSSKDNIPQQQRQFLSSEELRQNLFSQHQPNQYSFNADPNMNTPGRIALSQEMADAYARRQMLLKGLKYADVATDVMQLGNFVPLPQFQVSGKLGNILGAGIDAFQTGMDLQQGNYSNAITNAGSAILPMFLNTGSYPRANANTTANTLANKIASLSKNQSGYYIPLTAYPHMQNNQVIKRAIGFNRAKLGVLGVETVNDAIQKRDGGSLPSYQHKGEYKLDLTPNTRAGFTPASTSINRFVPISEEELLRNKLNRQVVQQPVISQGTKTPTPYQQAISRQARAKDIQRNTALAQTFASFTPGNNIDAGVLGAETFVNTNPVISGPIMATSRLAPFIAHPTNNEYFNPNNGVGQNALGALGLVGDIAMISPYVPKIKTKTTPKVFSEGQPISSSVDDISRNLTDLQEAQKFAKQYGYELPANLERISQSNTLTDRTIRGLMNRHNTFVRGVSTNWAEIEKRNPEILRHLEGKGFNLSTEEGSKKAAEYMATHIPISTGYGRASLNNNVFSQGFEGLYTSNSVPTAEGYTYGNGYIVKSKLPTNFSSVNRRDWILKNNPEYYEHKLPGDAQTFKIDGKLTHTDDLDIGHMYNLEFYDNINDFKNKVITDLQEKADRFSDIIKRKSGSKEFIENTKGGLNETLKKIEEIKNQNWERITDLNLQKKLLKTEHKPNMFGENFGDFGNSAEEIAAALSKSSIEQSKHSNNLLEIIKDIGKKRNQQVYDLMNEQENLLNKTVKTNEENNRLQELENQIRDLRWSGQNEVFEAEVNYLNKHFPGWQDKKNMYAHYIHLGTPGEKILEPIKTIKITPENWKNRSRAHTNYYTNKLTGLANGGIIKDNMGQWSHPGKVTQISSPNITMQGVPYPVLGVGADGQRIMMQPNQNYQFNRAPVTEYPMMQGGGSLWNTNKQAWTDSVLNANRSLDFVNRLFNNKYGSIPTPKNVDGWRRGQRSTHLMSYDPDSRRVYPEVVNVNGQLQYMPGDMGWNYADSTKEFIEFPTAEQAAWFANSKDNTSGYKMGTGVFSNINSKTGKGYAPKKEKGGEMIKRADGSYSQRGLWDNIRANKGSGKKPTKQMLEQERKIKSQYKTGGIKRSNNPLSPYYSI